MIGRKTPGLMLAAVPVAIEGGWTLLLPVWDFRTPQGARVEGQGVEPDIAVKFRQGKDADLAAALKFLKAPVRRSPSVQARPARASSQLRPSNAQAVMARPE